MCMYTWIYILIYILCASYLNIEHGALISQTQSSHLHELSIKNIVQYKNNVIDETNKPWKWLKVQS